MICFLTVYHFPQRSLSTLPRFYPTFDWWYCTWEQHFTVYRQCLYICLLSYQVRLALFSGAPWKSNQQLALWNTEKTIYLFLDPRKTILTCVVVQPYETGRKVYKFTLHRRKSPQSFSHAAMASPHVVGKARTSNPTIGTPSTFSPLHHHKKSSLSVEVESIGQQGKCFLLSS